MITFDSSHCQRHESIPVATPSGYIGSVSTDETGCGSTNCPWSIRLDPDQRINITLVDFNWDTAPRGGDCHVLATVREPTGNGAPICAMNVRESHAYLTRTNTVEIRIIGGTKQARSFLLKYEGTYRAINTRITDCYFKGRRPFVTQIITRLNVYWRKRERLHVAKILFLSLQSLFEAVSDVLH